MEVVDAGGALGVEGHGLGKVHCTCTGIAVLLLGPAGRDRVAVPGYGPQQLGVKRWVAFNRTAI